tara:strand:+ start:521 stop:1255 length:735 start_codon:yes stop_codon:yes gene_type:complete
MQKLERLSKIMASRGICSRREADKYIERGLVLVNNKIIDQLGSKVATDSVIILSDKGIEEQKRLSTMLLNKPVGYVSGQPEKNYEPAISLISELTRWNKDRANYNFKRYQLKGLAPAGRLDIDSCGLLVLTQDGRIARKLINANSNIDKEYLVRVKGRLNDKELNLLNHGIKLDGKELKPAKVTWQNKDQLRFVLREGKKRQIRRMCEQVGLRVTGLKRIRIGKIKLGNLPEGMWRFLDKNEQF